MIFCVFRVRIHFGARAEAKASLLRETTNDSLGDVARLVDRLGAHTRLAAVLFDAEHAAGLEHAERLGENLVRVSGFDPIVDIAKREHEVDAGAGPEIEIRRRNDLLAHLTENVRALGETAENTLRIASPFAFRVP